MRAAPGLAGTGRPAGVSSGAGVVSVMRGALLEGCCRVRSGAQGGAQGPEVLDGRPGGAPRRGDDRRDADAVVGRPRDLDAGQAGDVGAHGRDGVDVPDGVLRQAPTPPLHVRVDDPGQGAAERLADLGHGDRDEVGVVALERGLLTGAADRGAQVDDAVGQRPGPRPLVRAERARLDRAALDRRHEEPRPGQVAQPRALHGQRHHAPSRPSRPPPARQRPQAHGRRAGARPVPGGRRGARRRPRPPRGLAADPTTSRQPDAVRPRPRTTARVRSVAPRDASSAASRPGSRPTPPRRPANAGRGPAARSDAVPSPSDAVTADAVPPPGASAGSRPASPAPTARASWPATTAATRGRRRPRRAGARRAGRRPPGRAGCRRSRRPRRRP